MLIKVLFFIISAAYTIFLGHALQRDTTFDLLRTKPERLMEIVSKYVFKNRQQLLEPYPLTVFPSEVQEVWAQLIVEDTKKRLLPLDMKMPAVDQSIAHNGVCGLKTVSEEKQIISIACDGRIAFCDEPNLSACEVVNSAAGLHCACMYPEGKKLFVGDYSGFISVWNYDTKALLYDLPAHEQQVNAISLSTSQDLLASCSVDPVIKVWAPQVWCPESPECLASLYGHTKSVKDAFIFNNNQYLVSGSFDGSIKLWDLEDNKVIHTYQLIVPTTIGHISLHPSENAVIAGLNDGRLCVFDIRQNKEAHSFKGHNQYISALLCNADGTHVASGSWDRTVKMWDLRMLSCAATLIRHVDWVQSIATLNDFKKIVSGSRDGAVKIWDLSSVMELDNIKELTKSMNAQSLTQNDKAYTNEERIALLKKITD